MKRIIAYLGLKCLALLIVSQSVIAQVRVIDNKGSINSIPNRLISVSNGSAMYIPDVNIVDDYLGVILCTTTPCSVILPSPTNRTSGKIFIISNSQSSGASLNINTYTIPIGMSRNFVWDGSSWSTQIFPFMSDITGDVTTTAGSSVTSLRKIQGTPLSLSLLTNGDLLQYNGANWINVSPSLLGYVISLGAIDGQTKSASLGGTVTSNTLYLQTADQTYPGLVSTTTQTFGGDKIFNNNVSLNGTTTLGRGQSLIFSGSTSGTVTFNPAVTIASYSLKLPPAQGVSGQTLQNDGWGNLYWAYPTGMSNGTTANNTLRWDGSAWTESSVFTNDATNIATTGNMSVNGGSITTTATIGSLFNAGTSTVNIGGAATAVSLGATSIGTCTVNNNLAVTGSTALNGNTTLAAGKHLIFTGATTGTVTVQPAASTIAYSLTLPAVVPAAGQVLSASNGTGVLSWATPTSIGNGTTANNTLRWDGSAWTESSVFTNDATNIATTGNMSVNGGSITTTSATGNLFNSGATTVNIGGTATLLNLGASGGSSMIRNNLVVTGSSTLNGNVTLAANKMMSFTGNGGYAVGLQAPSSGMGTSYTLTMPSAPAALDGCLLASTSTGVLNWISPSSLSNIYTADGTLTANRTVTQGGNALTFNNILTIGTSFAITGTGVYTGSGMFNVQNNALTTGTLASLNANALTSGNGLLVVSTGATLTSGSLLAASGVVTASTTKGLLNITNTAASTTGTVATIQANSTAGSGVAVLANGKVGIGTAAPASTLEVNGVAVNTAPAAGTTATIDFSTNNLAYTSVIASSFTLNNLKNGGAYSLVMTGTSNSGAATFTASGFTVKYMGTVARTSGKTHIYSFIVVGSYVFVTMAAEN